MHSSDLVLVRFTQFHISRLSYSLCWMHLHLLLQHTLFPGYFFLKSVMERGNSTQIPFNSRLPISDTNILIFLLIIRSRFERCWQGPNKASNGRPHKFLPESDPHLEIPTHLGFTSLCHDIFTPLFDFLGSKIWNMHRIQGGCDASKNSVVSSIVLIYPQSCCVKCKLVLMKNNLGRKRLETLIWILDGVGSRKT